jgi:hypothetical protein
MQAALIAVGSAFIVSFMQTVTTNKCVAFSCYELAFGEAAQHAFASLNGIITSVVAGGGAAAVFYAQPGSKSLMPAAPVVPSVRWEKDASGKWHPVRTPPTAKQ